MNDFENYESNVSYLDAKNMAFKNFFVISGRGRGVVVSTKNVFDDQAVNTDRSSRLARGSKIFGIIVGLFNLASALIYLLVWVFYIRTVEDQDWTTIFRNAIEFGIVGMPFGLPIVLVTGFYITIRKFRHLGVIIKNINNLFTMCDVNVVLTDKTGTLTQNSLQVTDVCYSTLEIDPELCVQSTLVYLGAQNGLSQLLDLCEFCTVNPVNSTERALLEFARKNKPGFRPLTDEFEVVDEIEFSSNSKCQVKLVKSKKNRLNGNNGSSHMLWVRGAHDILVNKSKFMILPDGNNTVIDHDKINKIITKWSSIGRRVICLYKKFMKQQDVENKKRESDFQRWFDADCTDLVLVGMIGFIDPPRPGYLSFLAYVKIY